MNTLRVFANSLLCAARRRTSSFVFPMTISFVCGLPWPCFLNVKYEAWLASLWRVPNDSILLLKECRYFYFCVGEVFYFLKHLLGLWLVDDEFMIGIAFDKSI